MLETTQARMARLGRNYLDIRDTLCEVRHFVEAIFMAAGSVGDREEADALQRLAAHAKNRLRDAEALIQEDDDEDADESDAEIPY